MTPSTETADVIETAEAAGVELVRTLFVNNTGIPRGRVHDRSDLPSVLESGSNVTRAMQSFTTLDRLAPNGTYGPVGEVRIVPDPETFTVLPYEENTALLLGELRTLDGEPWGAGPRAQLRRYLDELAADGYTPQTSFESEFYLLRETDDGPEPIDESVCFGSSGMDTAHDVIADTIDALDEQGMPLSVYYPEYGPGQQELVIDHASGIAAADDQIRFTETVRSVARDHGLQTTFRPKPFPELPGSGCHVHLSVWNDGRNVFYDPDADGPYPLSDRGRQFVAGLLEHAPALLAVTAPTVESYDRIAPGMWSSAFTCWGYDNREGLVRVPSVTGDRAATTRLEFKAADNTLNPYLALLALLAAGFDGIDRSLDPGEPLETDPTTLDEAERERRGIDRLPETLAEALDAFAADDVLREAMGAELHQAVLDVKRAEWDQSTENGEWDGEYLSRGF